MKTTKIIIALAVMSATLFVSCEKKKKAPLEECISACLDFENKIDNIYYTHSDYSLEGIKNGNKSISVPTGTNVRVIAGWSFDDYKDYDAQVSKIYIKTSTGGNDVECELIDEGNSNGKNHIFPAYQNITFYVRFVLDNGEEQTVGPLTVTVNADNKTISNTSNAVDPLYICTSYGNISNYQNNTFYLFAPYYWDNGQRGAYFTVEAINNSSAFNMFSYYSPQTALFALTRDGLASGQVKLVAADNIISNSLYPEMTSKISCGLGKNYARFDSWNFNYDPNNFDFYAIANSISYSDLDTMSFVSQASELVVTKTNPAFKFITNTGKKGIGFAILEQDEKRCKIYFKMQR